MFPSLVQARRKTNKVKEILIDGSWIEEPTLIKKEIFYHFRDHFKEPIPHRPTLTKQRFKN